MNSKRNSLEKTKVLVGMAIFTAIVVVLQVIATALGRMGLTPPSLVLVPIVIGASAYGLKSGTWLGFAFGIVVLAAGISGMDVFTSGMWNAKPLATALICLVKGALAGFAAGFVFKKLQHINTVFAAVMAAIVCPIVNTGIFLLGASAFFAEYLKTTYSVEAEGFVTFLFVGLVGVNFLVEMAINLVLSPVIVRVLKIRKIV